MCRSALPGRKLTNCKKEKRRIKGLGADSVAIPWSSPSTPRRVVNRVTTTSTEEIWSDMAKHAKWNRSANTGTGIGTYFFA